MGIATRNKYKENESKPGENDNMIGYQYRQRIFYISDKSEKEILKNSVQKNDIIICTALVPGKKAPRIISENMVKKMKPGSIIYDLAVGQGGNSAFSESEKINIVNGVKIMGSKNILSNLALTASNLYSKNLFNFVENLYNKEKNDIFINIKDEIIEKTLINKEI